MKKEMQKHTIPAKKYFIGIDSDGTVFDSMGRKHTKALIPTAIKIWGLQDIESLVFEIAENINLYSKYRGINRFAGLAMTFEHLEKRLADENISFNLPNYTVLSDFVNSGLPLSLKAFKEYSNDKDEQFTKQVEKWSIDGNILYEELSKTSEPFAYVKDAITRASAFADCAVISSAPTEALKKEWTSCNLSDNISFIAGQEIGSKSKQLNINAYGKYERNKTLMIGDALGDLEAALENDALFYPIIPGDEETSWEHFLNNICDCFKNGQYTYELQETFIKKFKEKLR